MPQPFHAVLRSWHPMVGRDMHIPWPPGAPAPAPAPVPYVTTALMSGVGPTLTSKLSPSTFADGMAAIMVRGTDIGPMIPHGGPPSMTLAAELLTSGSKSHFGVTSLKVKDQTGAEGCVAVGLLGMSNMNLNCGTPAPLPVGMVIAPTTYLAKMKLGDLISGLYMMAWDYAAQRIVQEFGNALKEWAFPRVAYIFERVGLGVLGRTAARQIARASVVDSSLGPTARLLRVRRLQRLLETSDWAAVGLGLMAGSPLGLSTSTTGDKRTTSGYDRIAEAVDPQGHGDMLGKAIDDYFGGPSPSVTDVPATPGNGSPDGGGSR